MGKFFFVFISRSIDFIRSLNFSDGMVLKLVRDLPILIRINQLISYRTCNHAKMVVVVLNILILLIFCIYLIVFFFATASLSLSFSNSVCRSLSGCFFFSSQNQAIRILILSIEKSSFIMSGFFFSFSFVLCIFSWPFCEPLVFLL